MDISIAIDLSRYSLDDLKRLLRDGVISLKEFIEEKNNRKK